MKERPLRGLDHFVMGQALKRWTRAGGEAASLDPVKLKGLSAVALEHRRSIDRFLHSAEAQLAQPNPPVRHLQPGTDWSWRPDLWRGALSGVGLAGVESGTRLGEGATLFHDCHISEVICGQRRGAAGGDAAPYMLALDVFQFDGSFLSLVLDLPADGVAGLRTRHLVQLDLEIETESPLSIFARLNVKHGPNVAQIVRELPAQGTRRSAEFDLFYTDLNEKRVEQAWIDLIFETPRYNQMLLRDLTLSRRPRAEV